MPSIFGPTPEIIFRSSGFAGFLMPAGRFLSSTAAAVAEQAGKIADVIDLVAARLAAGGRLIYVGA